MTRRPSGVSSRRSRPPIRTGGGSVLRPRRRHARPRAVRGPDSEQPGSGRLRHLRRRRRERPQHGRRRRQRLDNYLACSAATQSELVLNLRTRATSSACSTSTATTTTPSAPKTSTRSAPHRRCGAPLPAPGGHSRLTSEDRLTAAGVGQRVGAPDPPGGLQRQRADHQRRHRVGPPPADEGVEPDADDEGGRERRRGSSARRRPRRPATERRASARLAGPTTA